MVERDKRLRETLGRLIEHQPDLCCDSALDCDRGLILRLSSEIAPEAVLMEPGPPAGGGLELLQALRQRCPSTLILVHSEQADRRSVMQALEAGACGYLVKPADGAQVIDALRSVLRGGAPIDPSAARWLLDRLVGASPHRRAGAALGLSKREIEVLGWLAKGLSLAAIASRLSLSRHTVSNHLRQVYGKLQVHSRAAAVARALEEGLI